VGELVKVMPLKQQDRVCYAEFVQWWTFFDAQKAFDDYDGKSSGKPDGQMDIKELTSLLRDLGMFLPPEALSRAMDKLDIDHSGKWEKSL
jgi:hypothetical protein